MGDRERRTDGPLRRAERAERERETRAKEAVARERARIARELHDVVAHSVSVMTVQAGAARMLLDHAPSDAREPLLSVEAAGRQALVELRRMLGVLRTSDAGPLEPQPGLADIEALIERVRRAGLPVELRTEGTPTSLAAGGRDARGRAGPPARRA